MKVSREKAVEIAADHIREMIERMLYVEVSRPSGRIYKGPTGNPEDYWYIKIPDLTGKSHCQLDGGSYYLAISKETGRVSPFSIP